MKEWVTGSKESKRGKKESLFYVKCYSYCLMRQITFFGFYFFQELEHYSSIQVGFRLEFLQITVLKADTRFILLIKELKWQFL